MNNPPRVFNWLHERLDRLARSDDAGHGARIALYAAAASLLVSLLLFVNQPLVNKDGILYLTVARELLDGNWEQAYWLFHWLFYPAFVAGVSFLSGLGVEHSAHLLNAFSTALLVWAFVVTLRELGASKAVQLLGAVVLLLHPYFNDWRPAIIREHGFYAFLMLSALFYLRYQRDASWRYALLWFATLAFATLFRIQGVAYFVLVPLITLLFSGGWANRRQLAKPIVLVGSSGAAAVLLAVLLGGPEGSPLAEPLIRVRQAWDALGGGLEHQARLYSEHALNPYTADYATAGLVATLLIAVIDKLVGSVAPLYLLIPLFTGMRGLTPDHRRGWALVLAYALTGLLIATGFALTEHYIVSRYVAPFSLFFLLTAPFFVAAFIDIARQADGRARRIIAYVLLLVFVAMSIDSLHESPSANRFVRDGGNWVRQNLPEGSRVYTNSNRLAFYADLELDWSNRNTGVIPGKQAWRQERDFLPDELLQDYDYAAITVPRKRFASEKAALLADQRLRLLKEIPGPRGGGTLVFRVKEAP